MFEAVEEFINEAVRYILKPRSQDDYTLWPEI